MRSMSMRIDERMREIIRRRSTRAAIKKRRRNFARQVSGRRLKT
jgi:hypothetical protein